MREKLYVGLDIATTTGIAIYSPVRNAALVGDVKGDPIYQFQEIMSFVLLASKEKDLHFVLEEPHHFKNANTVRSLVSRYGYIKYSLKGLGYDVTEPNLNVVRHWLGTKNKQDVHSLFTPCFKGKFLTSDHTDALAIAMYEACTAESREFNIETLAIYQE